MRSVGCLVGDPTRHGPGCVSRPGEDAVVLHRCTGQSLADHGDLGDRIGPLEWVDIGTVVGPEANVRPMLGEQHRCVGCEGLCGGDDRVEPFVVDDDSLGCIHRGGLRRRDNSRDDVANEANHILGENRAVQGRWHHRETLERWHAEIVAAGVVDGRDTGHRLGRGHVDGEHVCVGLAGANERDVQAALRCHVVEVLTSAGQQRGVLQSLNSISQDRSGSGHGEPFDDMKFEIADAVACPLGATLRQRTVLGFTLQHAGESRPSVPVAAASVTTGRSSLQRADKCAE